MAEPAFARRSLRPARTRREPSRRAGWRPHWRDRRRRRADDDATGRRQRGALRDDEPRRRGRRRRRRGRRQPGAALPRRSAPRRCSCARCTARACVRVGAADAAAGRADPRSRRRRHQRAGRRLHVQVADCLPVLLAAPGRARGRRRACRLARPGGRRASKPPSRRCAQAARLRARATSSPGSVPASGPTRSRSAPTCSRRSASRRAPQALATSASRRARRRQVARRPRRAWRATGCSAAGVERVSGGAVVHGRPTRHASSRTGATASPAAWPPPSGSPTPLTPAARSARRRAWRAGVPSRYSTMPSGSSAVEQEGERRAEPAAAGRECLLRGPSGRRRRARRWRR